MQDEFNTKLESMYVGVDELSCDLPLYNAIGSSGDKVIYEGIEYDSTMINAWEVLTGSSTNWRTMLQSALYIKPSR